MARHDRPPNFTYPNDDAVQSYLFGGLNTTATPLNTPFEDSPLLLNVDTNVEGSVSKRKGSRVLVDELNSNPQGVTLVPFASSLNYNLLVMKNGTSLNIYEVNNNVATRVMQKTNVFSSAAATVKASTVRTSESEPRILFFTGYNKPVQLRFIEQQTTVTGPTTTVTFNNASRFKNATTSNCLVYINRVRTTPSGVSYNSGTEQLTLTIPNTSGTFVVDIMLITWQWWAEAMLWKGDRYFKSVTRFNVSQTDQVVAIPNTLRSDLDPIQGSSSNYEVIPYKESQVGAPYTFASRQPQTADEYGFGDGSRYIYSANNYLNTTPFFLTFGALQTTVPANSPTSVYMVRRRELRLNNNSGIDPNNLDVYVNNVKRTWRITNTGSPPYMDYWLFERTSNGAGGWQSTPITVASGKIAYFMGFETSQLGVQGEATVETINKEATHIGSSAVTTRYDYNDGSYFPVYGIGLYADYKNGYYPSSVELFQGRLVLSGFSNNALTIVFSNVYDSVTPGVFFNFFQVTDDLAGTATDPFDMSLSSRPDDKLIATVEYQSSLFCLTRRATFRIHGGGQPVTILNHQSVFISNIGCVNNQSYVKTDRDIIYLADTGVYNLLPQIENQEYQASELSIKIRNLFGVTSDPAYEGLPWLKFDDVSKKVYLGYPLEYISAYNSRLLVFSTVRESWTEYTTPSGFNTFVGSTAVDRLLGNTFVLACTTYSSAGVPQDLALLKLDDDRYIDFIRRAVGTGVSQDVLLNAEPMFSYTTAAQQNLYSIDPLKANTATLQQRTPFDSLPVADIEDLTVHLNGVRLTNGLDYIKTPGGYVYLSVTPTAGQSLVIRPRRPVTDSERGQAYYAVTQPTDITNEAVYVDNHLKVSGYSVVTSGGRRYVRNSFPSSSVVEVGHCYLAVYSTPVFNNQSLRNLKQRKWVYAFFDNSEGQLLYTSADTNSAAGQEVTEITDTPKVRINASVTLLFSEENSGETTADIYGFETLVWDASLFDVNTPSSTYQRYQLFKEPLRGTGYTYQMLVWNYDDTYFKLQGYQIDGKTKGTRVVTRY